MFLSIVFPLLCGKCLYKKQHLPRVKSVFLPKRIGMGYILPQIKKASPCGEALADIISFADSIWYRGSMAWSRRRISRNIP